MFFLNHLWTLCVIFISCGTGLPETLFGRAFTAVWNGPTNVCAEKFGITLNFSRYDIIDNTNDAFEGDKMVIFYKDQLGLYPYILPNGTPINGGIPQMINLQKHLNQTKQDVKGTILAKNFIGPAVIDWESWRPLFQRNFGTKRIYKIMSRRLVKKQHPTWNRSQIIREAKIQFESAARDFMASTLNLGEELRSEGRWGFYGFPRIYRKNLNKTRTDNDRLGWLFSSSTGLYPSIYLHSKDEAWLNKFNFVVNTLNETLRIFDKFSSKTETLVVPYARFRYEKPEVFYNKTELMLSLTLPATTGSAAVILWDSSFDFRDRAHCQLMKSYLTTTLGPFIKKLTKTFQYCSERMCNGNGRCVKAWETIGDSTQRFGNRRKVNTIHHYNKMKHFERREFKTLLRIMNSGTKSHSFKRDIKSTLVCKCYTEWKGKYCQFHRRLYE